LAYLSSSAWNSASAYKTSSKSDCTLHSNLSTQQQLGFCSTSNQMCRLFLKSYCSWCHSCKNAAKQDDHCDWKCAIHSVW